jgi:hypothetical protein
MSLIVEKRVEQMSEGLHNVTITKVEDLGQQVTQFGKRDMAAIYLTDDLKGMPVDVRLRLVRSLHPDSSLARLLTALRIPFGDTFDLTGLVGMKCQVVIQHKEKDGKIDTTVAAVLKVRERAALVLHDDDSLTACPRFHREKHG